MEFWGVEVKPGETIMCEPGDDKYIHLSQASLGETKKANENVPVFVKFDNKKLVLGTLSGEKCAQIQYDLVFEKEFELSHSSKNTSVYFCGYKTIVADEGDEMFDDDSMSDESEEEEEPVQAVPIKGAAANGKPKVAENKAKADGPKKADASKPKPENKPKNENVDEDDSDDDDEDESDEDDEGDSDVEPKGMKMELGDDDDDDEDDDDEDDDEDDEDDDEDDSDEEEEEATPQKTDSKKRKTVQKTPGQDNKKAKVVSPAGAQKTDGKKGGHVATPHPAKQAPKTPAANSEKSKQKQPQTPKSGGSVACKSCSKTFNSENALQSHTKAKHG